VRSMSNKNLVPSPLYENSYANNRANNAKNFLDKDDILNLIISLNTTRDVNSFVALYGLPREEKKHGRNAIIFTNRDESYRH